jgi:DNA-directed RNA polymerase subunit M/transcription elongation factor TFIIS
MGGLTFKPCRAKCSECGNGMIKRAHNHKYCASCKRIEKLRTNSEYHVRSGYNKNPGAGMGTYKPCRAKCTECGNGMIKKSSNGKHCASCKKIMKTRRSHECAVRNGQIKNPGAGHLRGDKTALWKGGSIAWQRKHFRSTECERCGSGEEMHLHHRDRDRSNWKKSNLETLCAPCHREEHKDDGGVMYAAA